MGRWRQANTGIQRYPRLRAAVQVRISTVRPEIDPSTGKAFFRSAEETTADLSRGGLFVRSWEPLSAGRRVTIELELPDSGAPLQLVGRVVWTRRELRPTRPGELEQPGYGVEFVEPTGDERIRLGRALEALQSPGEKIRAGETPPLPPRV